MSEYNGWLDGKSVGTHVKGLTFNHDGFDGNTPVVGKPMTQVQLVENDTMGKNETNCSTISSISRAISSRSVTKL